MDWRDGPLRIRILERCHGASDVSIDVCVVARNLGLRGGEREEGLADAARGLSSIRISGVLARLDIMDRPLSPRTGRKFGINDYKRGNHEIKSS